MRRGIIPSRADWATRSAHPRPMLNTTCTNLRCSKNKTPYVAALLVPNKRVPPPYRVCDREGGKSQAEAPHINFYVIAVAHSVSGLPSQVPLQILKSCLQDILCILQPLPRRQGDAQPVDKTGTILRALETFQVTNARSLNEASTFPTA